MQALQPALSTLKPASGHTPNRSAMFFRSVTIADERRCAADLHDAMLSSIALGRWMAPAVPMRR
jgi:hypothetical protein